MFDAFRPDGQSTAGRFAGHRGCDVGEEGVADSATARRLIHDAFPSAVAETDFVVLHSDALTAQDADFRAVVGQAVDRYRRQPGVAQVSSPYAQPALISGDGHTTLVPVGLNGESNGNAAATPRRRYGWAARTRPGSSRPPP